MPLIDLIIVLVIIGLILWLIVQIPMDQTILRIIRVVVIVAVILWLLGTLGFLPSLYVPTRHR